jgi:AcrR family transcriptional regulator
MASGAATKVARGRPPRTAEQRAEQRARLLDGVVAAIRANGTDVSIDQMAAAAGVSKPVLYDEFGDKLGMADAVAVRLADRFERDVYAALSTSEAFDLDTAMRHAIAALVSLVEDEPQLYAFLVRSFRTSDRGFLDNALVNVIRDRVGLVVRLVAPGLDADTATVLTDGLFGFCFAAVESWHLHRRPAPDVLAARLAQVLSDATRAIATAPPRD